MAILRRVCQVKIGPKPARAGDIRNQFAWLAASGVLPLSLKTRLEELWFRRLDYLDLDEAETSADDKTLRGLFTQFIPGSRAEAVVAALRREPLERLGELTRVPGVDDSLALAVAPYVTVWSDGTVNVNSAPEPVLTALPAVGSAAARNIVQRRAAGEVFTAGAFGAPVSVMPTRLMLVSRGWQQGHPLTHEIQAVYAVVGPRLVLEGWEERDR